MEAEIRNPKHEIRNKFKAQNGRVTQTAGGRCFGHSLFDPSDLFRISNLVLRISA
jgi:hypothetical protein